VAFIIKVKPSVQLAAKLKVKVGRRHLPSYGFYQGCKEISYPAIEITVTPFYLAFT